MSWSTHGGGAKYNSHGTDMTPDQQTEHTPSSTCTCCFLGMQSATTTENIASLPLPQAAAAEASASSAQRDSSTALQEQGEVEALRRQADASASELAASRAETATALAEAKALRAQLEQLHDSYAAASAARSPGFRAQLERQLAEAGEMLMAKQQQLERLAGEKAAQQLLLERQVATLQQELYRAQAAAQAAAASSSGRGGLPSYSSGGHSGSSHDIIPMDALGEPYRRLARHNRVGGAVQATADFLDRSAAAAAHLIRQYPLARLGLFVYLVLIHLYVYWLIARMQHAALAVMAPVGGHAEGAAAVPGANAAHKLP